MSELTAAQQLQALFALQRKTGKQIQFKVPPAAEPYIEALQASEEGFLSRTEALLRLIAIGCASLEPQPE